MDGAAVGAGEKAASAPARQKYKPPALVASNENISAGAEKKSQETSWAARTTLPPCIGKVLKRLHYPLDVILLCVRWYVACSLTLRNLKK
jgi:hypothetical protein